MTHQEDLAVLTSELDEIIAELERLQTPNFQAWSRVQMGGAWETAGKALGASLCTVYGVLETYFLRVGPCFDEALSAVVADPEMKQTVLVWQKYQMAYESLQSTPPDRKETGALQTRAWAFLEALPEVHKTYVARLRTPTQSW